MKDYMKDLVYKENPFLALVPKNESPDGFAGEHKLPALNRVISVKAEMLIPREVRVNIRNLVEHTI
jgi:hypothetical protein